MKWEEVGEKVYHFLRQKLGVQRIKVLIERDDIVEYISFPEFEKTSPFILPSDVKKRGDVVYGNDIFIYSTYEDCSIGIMVNCKKPEDKILPTLRMLADFVYFAIHHVEIGERMRDFGSEMVHLIVQTTPTDALLWAMRTCVHLVGGDAGSVTIWDKRRGKMIFPYFYKMPSELTKFEVDFGKGLSSDIVKKRKGMIVEDYTKYPNRLKPYVKAGVKSIIGAPVIYGDTVFGAIGVFALKKKRKFSQGDLFIVESVGRICGALMDRVSIQSDVTLEAKDYINKMMFYEGLVNLLASEMTPPVRTILGLSTFLKDEVKESTVRKYVELIHSSALQLDTTSHCLYECLRVMSIWEPLISIDTEEVIEFTAKSIEKMYPFIVVRRPLRKPRSILGRPVHTKFIFSQVMRMLGMAMGYKGEIKVNLTRRKDREIFSFRAKGVPLKRDQVEMFILRNCIESYGGGLSWRSAKGVNEISFWFPHS